jgi:hypothetical protein
LTRWWRSNPSPLSVRYGSPVAARYLHPWRQLVAELGATMTPRRPTRRSGTTVRSLISGGALTNAINGAITVLDPGSWTPVYCGST